MSKAGISIMVSALICAIASPGWAQGTNRFEKGGEYRIGAAKTNFMQWATTNAVARGDDNLVWSKNGKMIATDRSDPSVPPPNKCINIIGFTPAGAITNLGPRTSALDNPGPVYANITDFTVNDDRVLFGFEPNLPPPNNKLRLMSCSVTGNVNVALFLKDTNNAVDVYSPSVIYDPVAHKERLLFLTKQVPPGPPGNPNPPFENVYTVTYAPGSVPNWADRVALTAFTNSFQIESVKWCPELGTNHQPLVNRYVITRQTMTNPPPPPAMRGYVVFTGVRGILDSSTTPPANLGDQRFDTRITNATGGSQGTWTFDGNYLMCGINTNPPSETNDLAGLYSVPSMGTNRTPILFPTPPQIDSLNKQWLCISPNGMRAAFTVNSKVVVLPLQCENPALTNAGTTNIVTDGGYTRATIPSQAIDSNYTFTIVDPPTVDTNRFPTNYIGNAREFGASGIETQLNFLTNVEMSLYFEDSDIPAGMSATNMSIYVYTPQANAQGQTGTWTQVQSTVDTNTHYVMSSNIMHFSTYALGARVNEATTLTAPTGVTASDGTYTDKIHVAWNSVTGATSYLVYGSLTNTTSSANLVGASVGTTYDDTGATNWPGLSIFYWVKAINSLTNSDYSLSDQGYCAAVLSGSADLAASSFLFLPATITAGAHPDYAAFVIRNIGPDALADATVSYYFYLSRYATYDTNNAIQIGGFNDTLRLAAGANATITLTDADRTYLTIPTDATGIYYIYVRVRATTISDPDLNNNIAMRSGTITIDTGSGGPKVPLSGDFDGDGKNDLALYQESSGTWSVKLSASGYAAATATLGGSGNQAIPKDFDGDGKTDPAIYNEITGDWAVMLSASGYGLATLTGFGGVGYTAVIQDFDGDGKADLGVYNDATGGWQVKLSGTSYATAVLLDFGGIGYLSAAMDYDGDGKADPATYQESTGNWVVKLSASSYTPTYVSDFGGPGYLLVVGMYDQDARADAAIYETATGNWSVLLSAQNYITGTLWDFGGAEYTPVVGDFDGDGKVDPALYQASTSTWFVKLSGSGYATATAQQ